MKVAVWVGAMDAPREMVLLADNKVYSGMGPYQTMMAGMATTLGGLREEWGDDAVGAGFDPDTPCVLYESGEGFAMVVCELEDLKQ